MKKLLFLSLTVLATSFFALSLAQACNDNQFACEAAPGEGDADCCSCAANEVPDDSDGNGIPDGCSEGVGIEAVKADACHGQYDLVEISPLCDNTIFACCRIPRDSVNRKTACHGHEAFADFCPKDGIPDGCCLANRKKATR
ncbi:MAG TPA: hypothetical protein VLJ37_07355 [bacterium]|nr:hypothetical protein [bacterium]